MTIASRQMIDRIDTAAGSELHRGRLADGTPVLLKFSPEYADAAQAARLQREYLLLQSLDVAGIAKPLAFIDERGGATLVLQDFTGERLDTLLAREPRLDVTLCLRIGLHLAEVLAALDVARVIHRDIRPANLLVEPHSGELLLVDFSMASTDEANTLSTHDVVTLAGSWAYVSPEQTGRMNRTVDYRTDYYSMGVLLYRLLTGQLPFQASDPLEWTHCHIARVALAPAEVTPEVPQALSDVVMKLLAKLPEDRYQSAHGLRADLERCLAQWLANGRIEPFPPGTQDVPARFQMPRKLYGRDAEVERLFGAFEQMVATGQAALATVSGYSGIGKSELVDAARAHLDEARRCFVRLGAHGKVPQLDERMPRLREASASHAASSPGDCARLDLLSVTKASQAISGQIALEDLVDSLMHILLENAGAQTGQLLLARDERLDLVAAASVQKNTIHVQKYLNQPAPVGALQGAIVNYVQRSLERVLLDDATQANPFFADARADGRQPKSVLCLPLLRGSALIGLLYLENNLATHTFTPERLSVLELLASQAAITLENARLYRDLAEREARIRRLVESNIIGIIIFHMEGRIQEANQAFLRMVGYDRDDLVSGRLRWIEMTPPEWTAGDDMRRPRLAVTSILQPYEKEYFRKDGSRLPIMVGVAMFEPGGDEGVGFVLDLTEAKQAEAEARINERRYREVQMELAHLNRAATMGQLTASIAHEVQQPISAATTAAAAALRWLNAKPAANLFEARQALELIVNEAMRAGGIISGIRSLVQKAPSRKERVDINEAVRDVIELTQGEAGKHEVAVLTVLGEGLPLVVGDRVQLQQVMLNLIVNAIEAMSARGTGTRELKISTSTDTSHDVTVEVRDSGPGLPPVDVSWLFDPFYTTKENGLGMGLSICCSIAEAHGGRLLAGANQPHGAVFQLVLPRGELEQSPSRKNEVLPAA